MGNEILNNATNFALLLVELGLNSLDELIKYMNECRRECEHSCDYTDSLSRAERQAERESKIFGECVSARDDWFSAWFDYQRSYADNFSIN